MLAIPSEGNAADPVHPQVVGDCNHPHDHGARTATASHCLIAQETYRCPTPPLVIALQTGGASGVLELQWQGGAQPFRLQRCLDLAAGSWQSDELNFATDATTVSSAPQQYFRVLQLGQ